MVENTDWEKILDVHPADLRKHFSQIRAEY